MTRLRTGAEGGVLTYKEEIESSMQAKVRKELEVRVSSVAEARAILEGLGMEPIWRYQKYRTTYRLGSLHALVDETPVGNYLELEGPKPEIDRWAGALGLGPDDYMLETYRDLHDRWCEEKGLPEGDMVFPEGHR